ncbi:MAG: HvfC/BufC family peptide modification chaperone [Hyphomicrobium sp.]
MKKPRARTAKAPKLSEIQDRLQTAILTGDDAILDAILDNSRTSRETLFSVYRNAYVGRLVEILQSDYPLLRTYVGDDDFGALARAYIAANPSRTQNARWFGARLPECLAGAELQSERPQLAEIAGIEKAVANAFDAQDAPALALADLMEFPPEDWGRLSFAPHPSATRLDAATNAFDLWKALKDESPPPVATTLVAPERLIVWRSNGSPMVRAMTDEETMMWTEACRGVRFEVLCEMLATFDDPDTAASRAAGYLQGWLASAMLTSVALVDRSPRATSAKRRRAVAAGRDDA